MYKVLVKTEEKNDVKLKDMPVQKKSCSKYEPLGYTQCDPAKSRQERYFLQKPTSKKAISEDCPGDGGIIQMYKFMEQPHPQTGETDFCWDSDDERKTFMSNLSEGMESAIFSLILFNMEVSLSEKKDVHMLRLAEYAREVQKVLADKDLEIYPMCDSDLLGLSQYNVNQISINVNKHEDPEEIAKTLIHEAFHIIGGCFDLVSGPNGVERVPKEEQACNASSSVILRSIKGLPKEKINADTFAQLIMQL